MVVRRLRCSAVRTVPVLKGGLVGSSSSRGIEFRAFPHACLKSSHGAAGARTRDGRRNLVPVFPGDRRPTAAVIRFEVARVKVAVASLWVATSFCIRRPRACVLTRVARLQVFFKVDNFNFVQMPSGYGCRLVTDLFFRFGQNDFVLGV